MAKKTTEKEELKEKIYVIPLRSEIGKVPRYRRAEKAIKAIKEFLARHMKVYDRDLSKVKLDSYVNEFMWARGIRNPPHKIKVKATIDKDGIVRAELVDYPNKLKFKKMRAEKLEQSAKEIAKKKKEEKKAAEEKKEEKTESEEDKNKKSDIPSSSASTQSVERKKEAKEKKAAVVEAGKEFAKKQAKKAKHEVGGKKKEPKIKRMAMQK